MSSYHFVFIARGNGSLIFSSDVGVQFKAELFDICDVSFTELAHFIERNFQLNNSEAEVIAYRLQETFKRYELSAHPSYLAAISNTTLAALINANRRSELIQLAVDGTLSFVVADDKSDVQLSRTTRSRFLQKLVRAIKVDGKTFKEADLVQFTSDFAEEFDFDINAVTFIGAFVERGILHFENGKAIVSLPYIESYLLARELLLESEMAVSYFKLPSSDVDYPTLDIYAELGPADVVVNMISTELERAIEALPSLDGREHAIMKIRSVTGDGAPSAKFTELYSQMQDAIDEVIAGKPASERKQQILDMRDNVRSTAANQAQSKSLPSDDQEDNVQLLTNSVAVWSVGLILINSAAEHLRGTTKQNLAEKIIVLASRVLDAWTDRNSKVNFGAIRERLTSEEHISNLFDKYAISNQNHVKNTIRALMGNILDLIEEGFVTLPITAVLGGICSAHQRVLGRSLSKIVLSDKIEKFIQSIWLLETDPPSGEEPASLSIRELPRTPVLRTALCNHLVASAYWNHSNTTDRKHIVAVANAAIQPFKQKIDPKILEDERSSD